MWDVFISHASEDQATVARPLAERLRSHGLAVWYDEFTLQVGDRLRQSIDRGLSQSRYGVVIFSRSFFGKQWPREELEGLSALETTTGRSRILPIWHGVDAKDVAQYSATLAGRIGLPTSRGTESLANAILKVASRFTIQDHRERFHDIDITQCRRDQEPIVPRYFQDEPERISSPWLQARLASRAKLRLYFDPRWEDGIWFVVDELNGDGEVINLDQRDDLRPESATTTSSWVADRSQS